MTKILIVEDNPHKLNRILDFIMKELGFKNIEVCGSFTSGWNHIKTNTFDFVCLDMSLPTFDKTEIEGGGRFRVFGGKELAQKIKRKKINSKFAFVTHYKNFSDNNKSYSFEEISKDLKSEYPELCLGVIFYSNKTSEWRDKIKIALEGLNQ